MNKTKRYVQMALAGVLLAGGAFAAVAAEEGLKMAPAVPPPTRSAAPLRDKTLLVWAAPANLSQKAGSALTLDDLQAHFDGIVFGELAAKRWMPGSDFHRRTLPQQTTWPEETAEAKTFVQIAITYKDRQVTGWTR